VSQLEKLIAALPNSPRDVRLDDDCYMAVGIRFVYKGGESSHRSVVRSGQSRCSSTLKIGRAGYHRTKPASS
jgi:hypothetical protein